MNVINEQDEVTRLVAQVREVALESGTNAYFVGGYVRDKILRRPCKDVDVVVAGEGADYLVAEVANRMGWREPVTFARYGTFQTHGEAVALEVVRARVESYTEESRKPTVRKASLEEDILRRDFTFNALAESMQGNILDLSGKGIEDLNQRILRTPLEPVVTFSDDPLRILRGARMVAQLGMSLAPGMHEAMAQCASRCSILSPERIADELRKILVAKGARAGFELLGETGVLALIAPELDAMRGCDQDSLHHLYDVFGHTMRSMEVTEAEFTIRLATLCHDIGKPATRKVEQDGRITFHGHAEEGAKIAEEMLLRLRFGKNEIAPVIRLVELHMRPMLYDPIKTKDPGVRRLIHDAGDLRGKMLDLARADSSSSAHPGKTDFSALEARMEALDQTGQLSRRKFPLGGGEIMKILEIGPGPQVGAVQHALEEAVILGEVDANDLDECRNFVYQWGAQLREDTPNRQARRSEREL